MNFDDLVQVVDALGSGWGATRRDDNIIFERGDVAVHLDRAFIESHTLEHIVDHILTDNT